jgi:hypothetical protein
MSKYKFSVGRIVLTEGIHELLAEHEDDTSILNLLLTRHQIGDWGNVDAEDAKANDDAVINGARILSSFKLFGQKIWIITEWDRSITTVLLPSEY